MQYTSDPLADFAANEWEKEKALAELPKCDYCNEHIQGDYCFEINDEVICEDCLFRHFRRWTEDLKEKK